MSDGRAERAFEFLRSRDGQTVTVAEISDATGWSESTVRTYAAKHWKPWLPRTGSGEFRVQQFGSVSLSLFLARQSQVKAPPGVPPSLLERVELALRTRESQEFEFKQEIPPNASRLSQEFAAFATSNDGLVLIGVSDGGTVVGVKDGADREVQAALRERIEQVADKVQPGLTVSTTFVELDVAWVMAVEVKKGGEPVYYSDGRPYVRSGSRARPATPDEVKRLVGDHLSAGTRDVAALIEELKRDVHAAEPTSVEFQWRRSPQREDRS